MSSKKPKANFQQDAADKGKPKIFAGDDGYLWSMSRAPRIDESIHWFQMLPATFFTAFVIIITRMCNYTRPMSQFFWSGGKNELIDFFSFYKMLAICACGALVLILLLYRIFCQELYIKKSFAYIPILIYISLVTLSYVLCEYKYFALLGYNERFEGMIPTLCYMVLLFYIINSVNTEKNVKWIIYPLTFTSILLGLLGLSQALDKDFFRTTLGQKFLVPNVKNTEGNYLWDLIDQAAEKGKYFLEFTFQDRQIYQTVYNINYVSFYLTLLIPLFGMIFIRSFMKGKEEALWKKLFWVAIFTLTSFNIIGSASSGGYLGLLTIIILGIVVLNRRILEWWKPVVILLLCFVLMAVANVDQLSKEIEAAKGFFVRNTTASIPGSGNNSNFEENSSSSALQDDGSPSDISLSKQKTYIDYIDTMGSEIRISVNGNEVTVHTDYEDPATVMISDSDQKNVPLMALPAEEGYLHRFDDPRFSMMTIRPAVDDQNNHFQLIYIDDSEWPFILTPEGVLYVNQLGALVDLNPIEHIGFKNNPGFGSGRGYIWSTAFPMIKDTILVGRGPDIFCLYFPHNDYVGKYNADWNLNLIVDKPHMMYLGIAINTGLVSLLALLFLWGAYIVQSIGIYAKRDFQRDFNTFVGMGIFLGVTGFLAAGLVNDSTVSVMPMFYGLLGMGIAINIMLKRQA